MRRLLLCAWALAAPLAPVSARPETMASSEAAYQALLAADRAWSDRAAGHTLPDALAAMMDRDAVMVAGGASALVRGAAAIRERLASRPENLLAGVDWRPVGGGISADGSQGFTYGAMTVRGKEGSPQPLKYLAYWIKRPQGWRVFAYKRLGAKEGEVMTPGPPILGRAGRRADDAGATLKASERAFSDEAQAIGLRAAFQKWGREDSVNMGAGDGVTIGAHAIGEGVAGPEPTSTVTWAADEVMVAGSGDMGLSYGLLHLHEALPDGRTTVPFFTIWARPSPADPWRYVAE